MVRKQSVRIKTVLSRSAVRVKKQKFISSYIFLSFSPVGARGFFLVLFCTILGRYTFIRAMLPPICRIGDHAGLEQLSSGIFLRCYILILFPVCRLFLLV